MANKFNFKGFCLGFVVAIVLIGGYTYTAYNETHYTRQGYVEKESNHVFLFYDNATDNVFSFESNDLIKDGTQVKVYMDTNNTDSIYDDIIYDYKIIP
jgi:hypothetical protein